MDKKQQKPNSEAATCAVQLDSLQTAFIWSLVILVSTVVFLFGVLVCNAAAETSRQRRRERNNNIYRNRSNLLLRQQQQQQQQQPPPPTYSEALLHNLQNYQLSRIRPAGSNAAAAAASESGAGVRERIQQHRVGIITSGNRIIRAESDTLLATVYATVPETAEQIKLQRKLLRSLQKFRFVIDSRPPSRACACAAAARIPRIQISEQPQPQQQKD